MYKLLYKGYTLYTVGLYIVEQQFGNPNKYVESVPHKILKINRRPTVWTVRLDTISVVPRLKF